MNDERRSIRREIIAVVSRVFALPPEVVANGISPDRIETWDSGKHVELVIALEEHFGCFFAVEQLPELTSLEQMEVIIADHARRSNP